MQWYYAKGGEQVGPLEDHAFHELVRSNQISADTPVWREGMPNWIPYGQISGKRAPTEPKKKLVLARDASESEAEGGAAAADDATPAGTDNTAADASLLATLIEPLYRARKWIQFIGILSILGGALYAISLIGIVIAWLPIWMGILLTAAAKQLAAAYENGDEVAAVTAMDKLRLYFKIMGILAVISLVFGLAGLLLGILLPALAAARHF